MSLRGLLACSLLGAVAACRTQTSGPIAPPPASREGVRDAAATAPVVDAGSVLERLRAFRGAAQLERSAYQATAANRASYQSSIRKIRNQFEWAGIFVRIPDAPLIADIERDLRAALLGLALSDIDVRATVRAVMRRTLPATIPEGEPWRFEDDDFRGLIDVRVSANGVVGEKSRAVLDLFHRFTRLLSVASYADTGGRLEAALTAYYFVRVDVPKMVPRVRDADAALRAAGIDPAVALSFAEAKGEIDGVRAEYDAMRKDEARYRDALVLTNDVQLWTAKLRFFKGLARPPAVEKTPEKGGRP